LNNRINNQQKQEIGLDVMGGRNSESTPAQSLFRYLPLIMQTLKVIRLLITFYRGFFVATFSITIICIIIFFRYGITTLAILFWFKMITLILIYYFIQSYKSKEFFYYQNLGVSKFLLWTSTLTFDFFIFLASIITTYKLR